MTMFVRYGFIIFLMMLNIGVYDLTKDLLWKGFFKKSVYEKLYSALLSIFSLTIMIAFSAFIVKLLRGVV